VLIRADGTPIYTLASVVDDIEFGITHIIRGEDHVTNTAVQLQLFEALNRGRDALTFAHFTLLHDISGHKLSKRGGSLSIGALRDQGLEAMAINSVLARLGTSDPIEPKGRLDELVAGFDLGKFSRAAPKLELEDLQRLNAKLLHELPFRQVVRRLYETLHIEIDEAFWLAVRPNISTMAEVRDWWEVCRGSVTPAIADPDFVREAAGLLPPEPWDQTTWSGWTKAVGSATGRKGKELFMPLRLALTAREHGPELKSLLPIIGRERAAARLSGNAA
jgi:glutamyl-tRNA synthetase